MFDSQYGHNHSNLLPIGRSLLGLISMAKSGPIPASISSQPPLKLHNPCIWLHKCCTTRPFLCRSTTVTSCCGVSSAESRLYCGDSVYTSRSRYTFGLLIHPHRASKYQNQPWRTRGKQICEDLQPKDHIVLTPVLSDAQEG